MFIRTLKETFFYILTEVSPCKEDLKILEQGRQGVSLLYSPIFLLSRCVVFGYGSDCVCYESLYRRTSTGFSTFIIALESLSTS